MIHSTEILERELRQTSAALRLALQGIPDEHYACPLDIFQGSSIGTHCRHVLEFFDCLAHGLRTAEVCYDTRPRDQRLETDRTLAISRLEQWLTYAIAPDSDLLLRGSLPNGQRTWHCRSSAHREWHYVVEHAVHHLALIRMGLLSLGYTPDDKLGLASSTLQYRQSCAL